jgi:hypothetical protein
MGILINHAHHARITGVESRSIPVLGVRNERNITEVLQSGSWLGQKVVIIGGGPSIRGLKFENMPAGRKIGINKAFVDYPVDVNYCMDSRFYDDLTYPQKADPKNAELRMKWSNFVGIKVFLRPDQKTKFGPEVFLVNNVPQKAISFDLSVGIYGGRNSGFGALMLAVALGCTKIGLLGYDMKVDNGFHRTHWHDGYWHQTTRSIDEELKSMQGKLDGFKEEFVEFADVIKQQGADVYNLNLSSALTCFQKITMDDFTRI